MRLFRLLLRKKQSKGHSIHSPFAFDLITNVLYSPYSYYAFNDIPDKFPFLAQPSKNVVKFNHVSFRLINYFKVKNILEVNPGNGLNSLYIKSPSSKIEYSSVNDIDEIEDFASRKFDAIFINIDNKNCFPPIESLLKLSSENTFWVINPIDSKESKQFCKSIVNHEKVTVSFDMSDTLIVFFRHSYYKQHYLV